MEVIDIDYLTAFFAAIVFMVIGAVWYSPALFGGVWAKLMQLPKKPKNKWLPYIVMFIIAYIMAFFLAALLGFLGATSTLDGIYVAIGIWFAFIATTQAMGLLWGKKSFELYLIDVGFWLVALGVMGGILGA